MSSRAAPNRDRWVGWVVLAWIIAGLACIGAVITIYSYGMFESGYGSARQPNITIWAVGIGQAVGGLMIAAVFTMINSIYQNSCDQLAGVVFAKSENASAMNMALRLTYIPSSSKLSKYFSVGDMILTVNDKRIASMEGFLAKVIAGENKLEYVTTSGESKLISISLGSSAFHGLKGEADVIADN